MGDQKKNKSGPQPSPQALAELFEAGGIELTPKQIDLFWQLDQLLSAHSDELDLSRLKGFESVVVRHLLDSALPATMIDLPSPLLDVGTGAGFPGLPIKIMRPELHLILAESRGKKLAFLDEVIDRLGLTGVDVYPHKVTSSFNRAAAGLITRDLEPIAKTLARAIHILPQGGVAIFLKGPSADDEIHAAHGEFGDDFELADDRPYTLVGGRHRRRLVVFKRVSQGPEETGAAKPSSVREIASDRNPRFKSWLKALEPKGIKKEGLAVASGPKQVREILERFPGRVEAILDHRRDLDPEDQPARTYCLRPELFQRLDLFGAGPPLLVVGVPDLERFSDHDWPEGATVFVGFQDPANVGAVIRTAAALGAARVVLLAEAAHPFHPKSLRAAGPSVFRVPLLTGPPIADLVDLSRPVIALSSRGRPLTEIDFPKTFGLLPGLEGPGLPDSLSDLTTAAIPMTEGVESLNAAAASAIALWEWRRRAF
jgi:16S rRNA (guanine527-N7)-methyltransferase